MTPKQRSILVHLAATRVDPSLEDLVFLFGAGASRQAMVCSLKLMAKRQLLETRYELRFGRLNLIVAATEKGREIGLALAA